MNLDEKQELVRLLHLYQEDMLKKNDENFVNTITQRYNSYHYGVKAQYEHARIIATKLSVEIGKSVKSNYKL